jgi:hypothetical protein
MNRRLLASSALTLVVIAASAPALNSAPAAAGGAMAGAAQAFLDTLNAEQRPKATFAFDDASRFEFRYTPRARTGLPLKEMTEAQRAKAHELLKTGLSLRGYTNATDIIALENVLRAIEPVRTGPNALVRDPELYFVSIYGVPQGKTPWGWKFEGHHISVNFTLVDGQPIVFAPSFFGSNPAVVRDGPQAGKRALREEEESGRALMAAFTDAQRAKVIFTAEAPREMLTAENREATVLESVGITYAEMTSAQKRLLEKVLDAYLGRVAPELAKARLEAIQKTGMDRVTFGWAGTLEVGGPHYYRVQGPTFLIEYDNVQNGANHIHSVWRDFSGDFGRDLLGEHYKAYAH